MSHRMGESDDDYTSPLDAPALQPHMPAAQGPAYASPPQPAYQPAAAAPAQPSGLRSSLLKKPLDSTLGANPPNMPRFSR
jgi:hypothetical protein